MSPRPIVTLMNIISIAPLKCIIKTSASMYLASVALQLYMFQFIFDSPLMQIKGYQRQFFHLVHNGRGSYGPLETGRVKVFKRRSL